MVIGGVLGPIAGSTYGQDKEKVPMAEDPEALKKAALMVDRHVAALYRKKKLSVPEVIDDPSFLRRSFLVTAGRIPTLDEAKFFLEIDDSNKREQLIGYLLQSDGYRSHMTNWAFDLLRIKDRFAEGNSSAPYMDFVRQAVTENKPWNEFTHQLLASKGALWEEGEAAVGYYIRDKGMPLDNLSNTMRIFAGTHMECAQCHDDPFGEFERMDFYQLAAFTNGQKEERYGPWEKYYRQVQRRQTDRNDPAVRLALWLGDNFHYTSLAGGGDLSLIHI